VKYGVSARVSSSVNVSAVVVGKATVVEYSTAHVDVERIRLASSPECAIPRL